MTSKKGDKHETVGGIDSSGAICCTCHGQSMVSSPFILAPSFNECLQTRGEFLVHGENKTRNPAKCIYFDLEDEATLAILRKHHLQLNLAWCEEHVKDCVFRGDSYDHVQHNGVTLKDAGIGVRSVSSDVRVQAVPPAASMVPVGAHGEECIDPNTGELKLFHDATLKGLDHCTGPTEPEWQRAVTLSVQSDCTDSNGHVALSVLAATPVRSSTAIETIKTTPIIPVVRAMTDQEKESENIARMASQSEMTENVMALMRSGNIASALMLRDANEIKSCTDEECAILLWAQHACSYLFSKSLHIRRRVERYGNHC